MTPSEPSYREIPLTQGKVAFVSASDFAEISKFKWQAKTFHHGTAYCAARTELRSGRRYTVYMHREILGLKALDKRLADHINHDTLDNTRSNLRIAANATQSVANTRKRSDNSSGFKGVYWHEPTQKWAAQIGINNKKKYLGVFESIEAAYAAYCTAALKAQGEFAQLY